MLRKAITVLAAASVIALAGCATADNAAAKTTPAPSVSVAPATTPSPTPTTTAPSVPKSARGNLIKDVGAVASLTYNDKTVASFKVTSIQTGAACTDKYASKPKNGQVVILTFEVTTTPDLASDPLKHFSLNEFEWKAIAGNGTTVNGTPAMFGCLDSSEKLPGSIGPAESATGKMAFDVPVGPGTLVFVPARADAGWEWNYGGGK